MTVQKNVMSEELKQAVSDYKNGNGAAFETIYKESQRYIYACIYNVVRGNDNEQDIIEDMLQDTYIQICKSIEQLQDVEGFLQWAGTIATRKCYAYFKKNKQYQLLGEEDSTFDVLADEEEFIPEEMMQNAEKRRLLKDIIDNQLNEIQRICIYEYYYNEKKQSEIAAEYDIPENTVKTHLSRAKGKIKAGVLDLEQNKNTRLYSFAPFFVLLFADEMAECNISEAAATKILSAPEIKEAMKKTVETIIRDETVSVGNVEMAGNVETVGKTGIAKLLGNSAAMKIVMSVAGIAVVGGLIAGITNLNKKEPETERTTEATTVQQTTTVENTTEEITEATTEETTEAEQEITLSEEEQQALNVLVSNMELVYSNFGLFADDSTPSLEDAMYFVFGLATMDRFNDSLYASYIPSYTIEENIYGRMNAENVADYCKEVFGLDNVDLTTVNYDQIKYEDGTIKVLLADGLFDNSLIHKVTLKSDGTYMVYATGEMEMADGSAIESRDYVLHMQKNENSPFGFTLLDIGNDEDQSSDSDTVTDDEYLAKYADILKNPYDYEEFYPEYFKESHPDYASGEFGQSYPENDPLWFALADADGNGIKELYIGHSRYGEAEENTDGKSMAITNVLEYDAASQKVIDLDGDAYYESYGLDSHLLEGGIVYSSTEIHKALTNYYNIFTGEMWEDDVDSEEFGKVRQRKELTFEWHKANLTEIDTYVQ